jgi:hypothetical protein
LAYFAKHFIILIEFFYIDYTTNLLKILFPKKNKKPFRKRPKGLECLGEPDRTILELFVGVRKVIRCIKS